jgi:hypothetical protein
MSYCLRVIMPPGVIGSGGLVLKGQRRWDWRQCRCIVVIVTASGVAVCCICCREKGSMSGGAALVRRGGIQ